MKTVYDIKEGFGTEEKYIPAAGDVFEVSGVPGEFLAIKVNSTSRVQGVNTKTGLEKVWGADDFDETNFIKLDAYLVVRRK